LGSDSRTPGRRTRVRFPPGRWTPPAPLTDRLTD
jgi:hypothetical protein